MPIHMAASTAGGLVACCMFDDDRCGDGGGNNFTNDNTGHYGLVWFGLIWFGNEADFVTKVVEDFVPILWSLVESRVGCGGNGSQRVGCVCPNFGSSSSFIHRPS